MAQNGLLCSDMPLRNYSFVIINFRGITGSRVSGKNRVKQPSFPICSIKGNHKFILIMYNYADNEEDAR